MKNELSNKQKLFDLLTKLGFSKTKTDKFITFKKDDEIFVYPNTKLEKRHYITTRKQLDMNGWMNSKDFNLVFSFLKNLI